MTLGQRSFIFQVHLLLQESACQNLENLQPGCQVFFPRAHRFVTFRDRVQLLILKFSSKRPREEADPQHGQHLHALQDCTQALGAQALRFHRSRESYVWRLTSYGDGDTTVLVGTQEKHERPIGNPVQQVCLLVVRAPSSLLVAMPGAPSSVLVPI